MLPLCVFNVGSKSKINDPDLRIVGEERGAPPTTPTLIEVIRKPEPCRKQILLWLLLPSPLIVFKVVVQSLKSGADADLLHEKQSYDDVSKL